jgi:hypothetical protein
MVERMSWTQAVCDRCWELFRGGDVPTRLLQPVEETCAACGEKTMSGIYVRADPSKVPYPRRDDVDDDVRGVREGEPRGSQ